MNLRLRSLSAVACVLALLGFASQLQASDRHDHNAHLWLTYAGDHPIAGSPWGVHLESQVRRADFGTDWQQFMLRPGLNYTINPRLMLTAGYAWVDTHQYGMRPVRADFPEHRAWQQVAWTTPAFGLDWLHRFRLEQRQIGEMSPGNDGRFEVGRYRYENRFRYMLRTTVPAPWNSRDYFIAWNEIFINFGSHVARNTVDQNRAFLGVGRRLNDHLRLEIGFLEQTLQQRDGQVWEHNHTLSISILSNWPFGHGSD